MAAVLPKSRVQDEMAWRLIGIVLLSLPVPWICEYILRAWVGAIIREGLEPYRHMTIGIHMAPEMWELVEQPVAFQVGVVLMALAGLRTGVVLLARPEILARRFPVTSRRMPDVRWFILAIRLLGLALIGLSLPRAAGLVEELFAGGWVDLFSEPWWRLLLFYPLMAIAALGQPLLGLYLVFRGQWLIRRCIRGIATRCPGCGYELRGLQSDRCPECALPITLRSAVAPASSVS